MPEQQAAFRDPSPPVVLVTGSAGNVGTAVLRALAPDYRTVALDRVVQPDAPPQVECVHMDVTKSESVRRALDRVHYAYGLSIASVVHLAAYHDFSGASSPLYDEVTVRGTARLLRALRRFQVQQLVFSSTVLVHRPAPPGQPIDEDWPLEPSWDYPRSKIETEQVLRDERDGIPVVSLRIAGIYADQCESIPLAAQIERIIKNPVEGRVFPGDPRHGQPYVHMDDAVGAIRCCIERREQLPNAMLPILIGEPHTYSYAEVQTALAKHLLGEPEWPTHQIPAGLAKAVTWLQDKLPFTEPLVKPWLIDRADDHYELDISRARTLLGWEPSRDLMQTIPRFVDAFAADPRGWAKRHGIDTDAALLEAARRAADT